MRSHTYCYQRAMPPIFPLDIDDAHTEDPCPERALACRALAQLGAPETALEAARRVDVVRGGLSSLDWARVVLGAVRGQEPGVWAWSSLTR